MKWLKQQRKVALLSARATQRAQQAELLKHEIHDRVMYQLRQPETLTWAFAAGAFVGAGRDPDHASRTRNLVTWMGTAVSMWRMGQLTD